MMYENVSPLEILALYTLNRLTAADIEPIFERFLTNGLGGIEVACLASESCVGLWDKARDIEAAFAEIFGDIQLTKQEATWVIFRLYLKDVLSTPNQEYQNMRSVINLIYEGYPELFPCSPERYVAQEYGINRLYATYYSRDHEIALGGYVSDDHNLEIRSEVKSAMERFYSLDSELPEDLRRIQELAKTTITQSSSCSSE